MNVVIVGRPNVGKSSLFNRLLGRKRALVLDTPGVTRDRIVEPAEWWVHAKQYNVNLIDTGGMGHELFREEIALQVRTAMEEAHIVLFVMDIRAGLTSADEEVFQELRRSGLQSKIPVIGVLNKADNDHFDDEVLQFYKLGLEHLMQVSAEHALGIDDLKDLAVEIMLSEKKDQAAKPVQVQEENPHPDFDEIRFEDAEEIPDEEPAYQKRIPSIAIIGQPNVGKSTMLNAICGEKRAIVSPIAGTTVDAIDTRITWHNQEFILVDTAGIRRKNKTEQGIEVLSVVQTRKTLERADLAILMIDAEKGVYDQDEKIAGLIEEAGVSVILVLNKWDTQVGNDDFSQRLAEEQLRKQIRFLNWAPLVFTTAKDSIGLDRLFRLILAVLEQRRMKINTKELTEFVRAEAEIHNPDNAKFYMVHQVSRHPPTFVAHASDPRKVHFSLTRHLVNAIRERWGYMGTPLRLHVVKTRNTGEK